ncbi:selenium metabolism-associated LysR family transcriptional regulator [Desulfuromonas sp. AOP6]|uniref:selenium metabolism-associated LysR family transcriptional regulator n=1 Tax=Desulfuromonas sp. AOP6 TaxID=1566351 RepID=UPI001282FB90|nr:selenium metabolism-associated LysR family transcriptional regulator [Desulfuromonas sp. AOP6]BCA80399.1 LysR family transcriptional regulator [Desulfuromonas sp. AOP6]
MDIKKLEVFCKVVDLKSFSKAAESVSLTQPTISEHIRQIEELLGEKLLDRLGREVLPTPAGELLYRYAVRLIKLRDETVQAMRQFSGKLSGDLVLGASTIPGAYILPRVIESFQSLHPSIRLRLKIADTAKTIHHLLSGEMEIGIIGAPTKVPALESRKIFSDRLILVVPPRHSWAKISTVTLEDLPMQPFILREEGSGSRTVMNEELLRHGFNPAALSPVAEIDSSEAVRQAVKAGLGIAILSSLAVAEDLEQGSLVQVAIEGIDIRRPFYLVQRKNRQLSPLAQAFLEHLLSSGPTA